MHAHLRACVRACVCLRACDVFCCCCVCVYHCGTSLYRPKERPELSVAFERPFTMLSTSLYDDIRTKEASQKRISDLERGVNWI